MITGVVLTKDEEKNIVDCLESLKWCSEIIIIDDYSQDRTIELAEKLGARVFKRNLEEDFSNQRNFALTQAKNEWVFFVDADERVPQELKTEIVEKIEKNEKDGYLVKRTDEIWGKELMHGETGNIKLLRLAKKNKGEWFGAVHEVWKVTGSVGELQSTILHYPHREITDFLREINYYTDLRAKELKKTGKQSSSFSIAVYPLGKFVLNYFIKLGFLDGIHGLVFAIMMSFHSFLVRGKLWSLNEK